MIVKYGTSPTIFQRVHFVKDFNDIRGGEVAGMHKELGEDLWKAIEAKVRRKTKHSYHFRRLIDFFSTQKLLQTFTTLSALGCASTASSRCIRKAASHNSSQKRSSSRWTDTNASRTAPNVSLLPATRCGTRRRRPWHPTESRLNQPSRWHKEGKLHSQSSFKSVMTDWIQ